MISTLPQAWQDYLVEQPESGMGYQDIIVRTAAGDYHTVAMGCGLELFPPIEVGAEDIISIEVLL